MIHVPGREVDGFLEVHAVQRVAQEEDRRPLVLLVAARRAEREIRLALAQHHRRRQRAVGPLAGRARIGVASVKVIHMTVLYRRAAAAMARSRRG